MKKQIVGLILLAVSAVCFAGGDKIMIINKTSHDLITSVSRHECISHPRSLNLNIPAGETVKTKAQYSNKGFCRINRSSYVMDIKLADVQDDMLGSLQMNHYANFFHLGEYSNKSVPNTLFDLTFKHSTGSKSATITVREYRAIT